MIRTSLLRVPPFPGARPQTFTRPAASAQVEISDEEIDGLLEAIRRHRVGGTYWGAQPPLPPSGYVLVRVRDGQERVRLTESLTKNAHVLCWTDGGHGSPASADGAIHSVSGCCDPWHLLSGAAAAVVDADDELAILAAIAGVPMDCVGDGEFGSLGAGAEAPARLRDMFRRHVGDSFTYSSPYSEERIGVEQAIQHCGFWRRLIDSNRDIRSAVGFAFWKRSTVAPLLWGGSGEVPFASAPPSTALDGAIAIWKSRTPGAVLADLERRKVRLIEVEDGFIRSAGLGADCVPPLSIVVDRVGVHFDPSRSSELEQLIRDGDFPRDVLDRARALRELIVASGVSKYAAGHVQIERRDAMRRHVLVPGQVEDDRSVRCGGGAVTSNFELLRRAREQAPDAYIIYKPHPDVEAGHRIGAMADELCLTLADEIVRDQPISALIELVDELHVNTSLAGFEALLRGKAVTTHGVPFYAGWGLTRDLGPVPPRRTATRSLDELVAAVLLLYPRYLDPVTGLPCPPEVLIRRLSEGRSRQGEGMLVRLRRLQGQCRRRLAELRSW